jgi:hypothetical protein
MYTGLHVNYRLVLSDFKKKNLNILDEFSEILISNVMKICQVGAELFHTEGRTDKHEDNIVFRNFSKAPNNGQ